MDDKFELGEINLNTASRLASQVVIPRLREEVFPRQGFEPFRLRDEVYAILKDEVDKGNLKQEQLDATCHISATGINNSLKSTTRWNVRNMLLKSGEIMLTENDGSYTLTAAAEIEEEQDEEADGVITGSIYAYTFPSLNKRMIKVGRASGNVKDRINQQLGTANPEEPEILNTWLVADAVVMESAIHSILKLRGKRVDAPKAKEWFHTSVDEVESIIKFVKGA